MAKTNNSGRLRKHLEVFLSGVIVLAPFAVTAYVIWWIGSGLDGLVRHNLSEDVKKLFFPGSGFVIILICVYLVGLLTRYAAFRWGLGLVDGLLGRVPVIRTIYEALRDVTQLFGGTKKLGQVVSYRVPGTEIELLGIRTATGMRLDEKEKVAVYLPLSYQFAGYTIYVPPDAVKPVDMTVEQALKLAATAGAGAGEPPTPPKKNS
jgi:uncharacterized membrane protein